MFKRLINTIGRSPVVKFWVRFSAAGPAVLAGAIAYNIIFALVPGGIALLTAASFFGKTEEAQAETERVLSLIAPEEIAGFIVNDVLVRVSEVVRDREGLVIVVGALVALWAGTRGVFTIMRVLTRVERIEEDRPWWLRRLIATGMTVALGFSLVLSSVLIVAGGAIERWLEELTDLAWPVALWSALRLPLALLGLFGFFWLLYRYAPARRLPGTWLAALLTTAGMAGLSLGFRFYVERAGTFGSTYGVLGALLALLLWLYILSYLILVSGSIAAEAARRWARRRDGRPEEGTEEMRLGLETLEQEVVGRPDPDKEGPTREVTA